MSFDTQLGFGLVELLIGVTIVGKYLSPDPNTKRFKRTLIYFNTDTQCKKCRGYFLDQATKRHLNNR